MEHEERNFADYPPNDERVMNGPGVNVPSLSINRWPYDEYHTTDDNLDIIHDDMLSSAADVAEKIVRIFVSNYIPNIFVARHLHKNTTAKILNYIFIMRQPSNRADGFRSKPKTHTHRTRRQWIFSQPSRQLNRTDDPRAIIIGLHGMTSMCLNYKLACIWIRTTFWVDNCCSYLEGILFIEKRF